MSTETERRRYAVEDHPTLNGVSISDVRGIEQMRAVEVLQTKIWGSDPTWIVPSHMLYIVSENDGIVLGAQAGGTLVGFVLGILARKDDTLFHASHMLGIRPEFQQHGIGAALKWRQRERALEQGLDLMTWTFDPLESRNAYFNLHKLGTISSAYREDYYGPMEDALNRGLPSDRLVVEWHLRERPIPRIEGDEPTSILNEIAGQPEFHPKSGRSLAISVPRNFQALKHENPALALAWRLEVRKAFTWALAQGYIATDFRNGGYVLTRQEDAPL